MMVRWRTKEKRNKNRKIFKSRLLSKHRHLLFLMSKLVRAHMEVKEYFQFDVIKIGKKTKYLS